MIDWSSGHICLADNAAIEMEEGTRWSLVACGDWMPRGAHLQSVLADPVALYGDVLPTLREADLTLLNVECVLGAADGDPIIKDGPNLRAPAETVSSLAGVPFHLACMANNHTFDYGPAGLFSTLQTLRSQGISTVGAGRDVHEARRPAMFQFGNTRVAIVNAAEGEEGCATPDRPGVSKLDRVVTTEQVAMLRTKADVIIVVVHAGREYVPVPPPYVRQTYRELVDAGADLVIGHHPHVPQGIETYRGVPIAYSLGNFVFWTPNPNMYLHIGYLLRAHFWGARLTKVSVIPYAINSDQVRLLTGDRLSAFFTKMERISSIIESDEQVAEMWNAYADNWFASQFPRELSHCAAFLCRDGVIIQALSEAYVSRFRGHRLSDKIARRLVGFAIQWLESKNKSGPLCNSSAEYSHMLHDAAVLRNRFDTLAHRELYLVALRRVMNGEFGQSPGWAREILAEWGVGGDERVRILGREGL